jgi:hypothetical protein
LKKRILPAAQAGYHREERTGMKQKKAASLEEAVSHLRDGAIVFVGGFG